MSLREKLFGKPLPNYAWRMGCIPRAIWFVVGLLTIPPYRYVAWTALTVVVVLALLRIG